MAVVLMLLAVSGSARRLDGEKWTGGEAASGNLPSIRFVKHQFLQQLHPGVSGGSYDKNSPRRRQ
ncbi:hypothetical protein HU200_004082 [Digitaria exilis]|uniref:Uncharacterized protein n=1 Tax=Digitaria exilis TaxID=1010633 RepID=A0A835FVQ3_9POAL|nr:hypothetical protein HU200_004082 [Digitaria exilis]